MAAEAMLVGEDGVGLLEETSPVRSLIRQAVIDRALELDIQRRKNLAAEIANRVAKALGG